MKDAEDELDKLRPAQSPTVAGSRATADSVGRFSDNAALEDTLHSLFLSISYEQKSPFKLWRSDRVLTRDSFLEMIPSLPGVLSDRLFSAFDIDNSGTIDFNEFLEGLHAMGETTEKKLAFLHRMYDLNGDGLVSKSELLMMLAHMVGDPAASMPSIEELVDHFLINDKTTLDFTSFAKLLQNNAGLRCILENFCYTTMPKILPFYTAYLGSPTTCASRNSEAAPRSIQNHVYIRLTATLRFRSIELSSPFSFCGWLVHKQQVHFAILKDKYLLLYQDPSDSVPTKAICLIGAHLPAHTSRLRFWRRAINTAEQSAEPPDVLTVDDAYLSAPPVACREVFEIFLARGLLKVGFATDSPRQLRRWVRVISDVLSGKLSDFHDYYSLKGLLGRGRFGTVLSAQHRQTGAKVAVKVMRRPPSAATRRRRRLFMALCTQSLLCVKTHSDHESSDLRVLQRTEINVLRLLNHQNIVRLLDVFYNRNFIYIVMPWSPAGDLKELLDGLLSANRVLAAHVSEQSDGDQSAEPELIWIPDQVCQGLLRGIVRGLSYLHSKLRNVIHRDIKPDNILLDLQIDDLIRDIIHKAEDTKRQCHLKTAQDASPRLLRPDELLRIKSSTAITSMASRNVYGAEQKICSEVSSAVDTIDQYLLDSPPAPHKHLDLKQSECLLGSREDDSNLQRARRASTPAAESRNAWLFLHVLLWIYKDQRNNDEFLHALETDCVCKSAWMPSNIEQQVSVEELLSLLVKHLHPRITDFGLSKILAPLEPQIAGPLPIGGLSSHAVEPMGTEAYAAPEVKAGVGYTTSADMWSLGVLTFQLLSTGFFPSSDGRPQCPGAADFAPRCAPTIAFVPKGIWAGIPMEAKDFIRALLQADPDARPSAEACLSLPWLAGTR